MAHSSASCLDWLKSRSGETLGLSLLCDVNLFSFLPFLFKSDAEFCVRLQVSRATGVADEALGNVRTVKAFAMEERELQ